MKKFRFIFTALVLTVFALSPLAAQAYAAPEDTTVEPPAINQPDEQFDARTRDLENAMPDEAKDILGDLKVADITSGKDGLGGIWNSLRENGLGMFKAALKSAMLMLVVILLCSLAGSAMSEGGPRDAVSLCGAVAVSAIALENVRSFIGLGAATLDTLSTFSKAILPTLCAAAASAGAFTSASAKYAATALFMDVLISLGTNIIMPLIMAYIAAVIAGAALGKETLSRLADMLKWVCATALTLLVLAFTAYISITGIVSGKTDEVAAKAAKSVLGTLLPVVGSVLSNAADAIVAGAGIIRNSIGVFGMLAVIAVCLTPILRLGAHYLVYKGTAALAGALTDKRMALLIDGVGNAFGMVLGLVGAAGIMLFISIFSSMKAVGAV